VLKEQALVVSIARRAVQLHSGFATRVQGVRLSLFGPLVERRIGKRPVEIKLSIAKRSAIALRLGDELVLISAGLRDRDGEQIEIPAAKVNSTAHQTSTREYAKFLDRGISIPAAKDSSNFRNNISGNFIPEVL
jgi:hypothetical protein